jgi:AcrR family transcriptional regulator
MKPENAKRTLILTAADGLLMKHGLRGTSMEAIAKAAGIAKPTLYAYFPDKQAVFKLLADQLIAGRQQDFLVALRGEGDIIHRVGAALIAKHKATMLMSSGSPHAAELYSERDPVAGAQFRNLESELASALEGELSFAGVERARLLTQLLLAASDGVGHKATSPAELGPALRLLCERLIRPDLRGS